MIELFTYDFMQRAFAAGILTGILCPLVGIFVIVRRQSLIGDGLGHIAFAGVTGGYLAGIYPLAGAIVLTVTGAVGIEALRRRHGQYSDMGLAIFFYAGIAMAIIFSTLTRMPGAGLLNVLFGSIITVSASDVQLIATCCAGIGLLMYKLFRPLMLMALDEDIAFVTGIDTGRINLLFSIATAIVVVVGMTVVGVLLVSALMIVPTASAFLLRRGFFETLVWAEAYSVLAVTIGLILSYYGDIAPGGTIVMTSIGLYLATSLAVFAGAAGKNRQAASPCECRTK